MLVAFLQCDVKAYKSGDWGNTLGEIAEGVEKGITNDSPNGTSKVVYDSI